MAWSKSAYADGELALLLPADGAAPKGYVVYVHGGGFCCTQFFNYKHSLTFLCRAGFAVVGVDYPQAPQSSFPRPQLAVLRAVRAAEALLPGMREAGFSLIGDSAGKC